MNVEDLLRQTLAGLDRGESQSKNEDARQADQRNSAEQDPSPRGAGGDGGVEPSLVHYGVEDHRAKRNEYNVIEGE